MPQKVRMKITCLSLNFENQRLEKCSSFLWCCLYVQQGFITSYPAADFLKSASKAYNEAFEYLTSECWPGFNLLPHSSHRKQPGCHTLPREFLCSAAKTHKHITNLTARCCYFCTKKVQRSPLSSDGAKLFIVSVLLQKNYFAIYWQDFVFKGFNLPKYTSLPHLWHSVITFTAVSQAKQFDLSKSDEKYSSLARKVRSCQWRHPENIPKYHCRRRG